MGLSVLTKTLYKDHRNFRVRRAVQESYNLNPLFHRWKGGPGRLLSEAQTANVIVQASECGSLNDYSSFLIPRPTLLGITYPQT